MRKTISFLRGRVVLNAPVTLGFTAICLLAYLLGVITDDSSTVALFSVYRSSALNPLFWLRLVCHVFGHATWEHLIGNMMLFLILAPMLEEKYGSSALAALIVVTAVITGLFSILFFPRVMLLGASGVIFALILLSSITDAKAGEIPLTFLLVAVLYLGRELLTIFRQDNISQTAHIIGGIAGAAFGFAMARRADSLSR